MIWPPARRITQANNSREAAGLAQLSRDQRDVLLLSAWAKLSHEEIAAVLELAPGTVRSRCDQCGAGTRPVTAATGSATLRL